MKKIYKNLISASVSTLLVVSITFTANAQRGGEHSTQPANSGGGGATAPAPQPRMAPAPQPRSNPQPQRNNSFNGAPQQRNDAVRPQRGSNINPNQRGDRNNLNFAPRGGEHANPPRQFYGRGSSLYPNRVGIAPNRSYRSYPGLRYGQNHITARPDGFYYRNRGSYRTYYTPQLGFRLNVLPYGYYPFSFGANQYFYSDGLFYQQDNSDYTVVEPPIGAVINQLPSKAQAIAINGMQYYELNGVYYQPVTKDDGSLVYQVAGKDGELTTDDVGSAQDDLPQVGDLVDSLPEGYKTLKVSGQKLYVSQEGYYFQDAVDTNGDKVYKIVGTPTDEPNQ